MKFYKIDNNLVVSYEDLPAELLEAGTVDAAQEKHVPVVEFNEGVLTVKVGSVPHPMLEEHFISDIVVVTRDGYRHFKLQPGMEPEIKMQINEEDVVNVYEYCNLHGLWAYK